MKFNGTMLLRNREDDLAAKERKEHKESGNGSLLKRNIFVRAESFLRSLCSFAAIFGLSLAFVAACPSVRAAESVETRLQQGLFEEEGNHNLNAAKKHYEAVLAEYDRNRKFAATALFHLAQCLRKEGKTNEARVQFERVVREFSHETELVKSSREALGEKEATTESSNNNLVNLDLDHEKLEIERITGLLRESPDLINGARAGQNSLIEDAAIRNYTRVVEFLLARGANPNGSGAAASPLESAVKQGNKEMVSLLLNHGANIRGTKLNGPSPLFQAVGTGNKEIVTLLLNKGADPGFGSGSRQPLHLAAQMGFKAIAEEIISHGADVNAEGSAGNSLMLATASGTPLIEAAASGNTAVAELLLSKGARPSDRAGGTTPLLMAARNHRTATVALLLEAGANIHDIDNRSNTVLHVCLLQSFDPSEETLKLLVKNGASLTARNDQGVTPPWAACFVHRIEAVKILIQAGANPNDPFIRPPAMSADARITAESVQSSGLESPAEGETPLFYVARRYDFPVAKVLLENGADPNLKTEIHPRPPFGAAIRTESLEMVNLFLEHHAEPNLRFEREQTALDEMETSHGERGQIDRIIELLKAHGAKENLPRPNAIAIRFGNEPLRTVFMRHGANDQNRYTLLETVCQSSDLQFPDLHAVVLRRETEGKVVLTNFDLATALTNSECPGSILLQWGDVVQIPEAAHAIGESWQGYSEVLFHAMTHCLTRGIEIRYPGKSQRIVLRPGGGARQGPIRAGGPPELSWQFYSFDFRLQSILKKSGFPASDADLHRIKVTRRLPGEAEPHVIECDLADHPDGPDNLWLRDGDIVEIATKD